MSIYEFKVPIEEHELSVCDALIGKIYVTAVVHADRAGDWYIDDWITIEREPKSIGKLADAKHPFWVAYKAILDAMAEETWLQRIIDDEIADRDAEITDALGADEWNEPFGKHEYGLR